MYQFGHKHITDRQGSKCHKKKNVFHVKVFQYDTSIFVRTYVNRMTLGRLHLHATKQ